MLTSERKAAIQEMLRRDGRLVAKEFSQQYHISEDTVRRDLRELASEGLLQRVHGGALPASPAIANFAKREGLSSPEKAKLGAFAASLIQPGHVVFLDGGTTNVQLVRHLPNTLRATIVTHSPSIAIELVAYPNIDVEIIGGRLFRHSVVALGIASALAISQIHADIYFMGATGIHPLLGITTGDLEEAAVKRLMSSQAAETIILATREKLGAASKYQIAPLSAISTIIAEAQISPELQESMLTAGVELLSV